MNRYGALLASVSASAILALTMGTAWAGAGDGLTFDTDSGASTNANAGTSYSSGTLTVNGTQTGTSTQDGLRITGSGSISPITVNIGAAITGGATLGAGDRMRH